MTGWTLRHPGVLNEWDIHNGWIVAVKVVMDLLVRRWRVLPQSNSTLGHSVHGSCILYISDSPFFVSCLPDCLVGKLGQDTAKGKNLFSQEGKIRIQYEGGTGILASLTGCCLLITF